MPSISSPPIRKKEVMTKLKEAQEVFQNYNVKFAYLAGSVAREEHKWWSDIDVFVSFPDYLDMHGEDRYEFLAGINGDLYRHTDLDKLEVRVIETLPLHIKFSIIDEGEAFYINDMGYLIDFKADVIKYYGDYKIWIDYYFDLKRRARYEKEN